MRSPLGGAAEQHRAKSYCTAGGPWPQGAPPLQTLTSHFHPPVLLLSVWKDHKSSTPDSLMFHSACPIKWSPHTLFTSLLMDPNRSQREHQSITFLDKGVCLTVTYWYEWRCPRDWSKIGFFAHLVQFFSSFTPLDILDWSAVTMCVPLHLLRRGPHIYGLN